MTKILNIVVPEVMNIDQCARYLGISNDTLYKYATERFVPAFKLGNRWRFKKSMVDEWMIKECEKNERAYPEAE
jgi:excisionase family DNA binding protein